jgi:hypothetical protein
MIIKDIIYINDILVSLQLGDKIRLPVSSGDKHNNSLVLSININLTGIEQCSMCIDRSSAIM